VAEPLSVCYLNGSYLPWTEARISPFDRGFLYADGVYEVMPVYGGRPFRFEAHCERLTRSLAEIQMADPHSRAQWREIVADSAQRRRRSIHLLAGDPRRGARPQPRAPAGYPANRVRLLRTTAHY
jgi:branched-subunit amino acid aminotransferase/4-amino-4-deoxychorismate lyase